MAVSTAKVTIEEHNTTAIVADTQGDIPWDDVNNECSFYNAKISREIYQMDNVVEADGLDDEIPPVRLFDRDAKQFPIGLKSRVTKALEGQGIQVVWVDKTTEPTAKFNFVYKGDEVTRDYQHRAMDELLQQRFGILQAPTGAGKTHIECQVMIRLGCKTLWVVHSADLVRQTAEFIEKYLGLEAGMVGAGKFTLKTVTVATAQSLQRKWGQIERRGWVPGLLIEDEVHHHGAWKNYMAIRQVPAYYRYGFSATPSRRGADRLLLEAGYGHVETQVSMTELLDEELLAPIVVRVREVETRIPKGMTSWQEVYDQGIIEHQERNEHVADAVQELLAEGRAVLIDVDQTDHITELEPLITAVLGDDQQLRTVTGSIDSATRKQIYDDFKAGQVQVLLGTVLREGLDLPNAGAVILAGGKKSQVQVLQQIGRGLRVAEGKTNCIVVDFNDNQHGLLLEHSQARLKLMRHVGFTVPDEAIRTVQVKRVAISGDQIDKVRKRQQNLARIKRGGKGKTKADTDLERAERQGNKQEDRIALKILKKGRDMDTGKKDKK